MGATAQIRDMATVFAARRATVGLRFGATLAIALILDLLMNMRWAWIWAGVYSVTQVLELLLTPMLREDGRSSTPGTGWRRAATIGMPFLTSATFGFLAIPLFASSARFAPTLGGMLLAGSLMHVVVANGSIRAATVSSAAPHVFYLLAVPLVAKIANPQAPLANALWFGAILLIAAVAVAARTLRLALQAAADARDEAERRRHEAEEAVAAKSAFVAMISHELRTPISAILAGAARLHSEVPDASAKVHAQLIADAGGLMRTLLNDLLDLSRLEAGRMSVDRAVFNLRQGLSDTLRLWRPEAARKGLRLKVTGAASLPRWVAGDAMRLKQVLNNLLSNAIKFTTRGEITVALGARPAGERLLLSIEVIDTGMGLSDAALARLFTPFDQLGAAVAREHGGSGLGLAISRELARLMGGDLVAAGVEGRGARFTLTLIVDPAEAPPRTVDGSAIAGARVLVVDDHVINRRAFELVLQPLAVDVTLAESAEQALSLLGAEQFDVVLMDVYMPGMDGREATRRLRAGGGPNRDAPVVAVTASASSKDWTSCAEAGMNAHVAKPIDPVELFAAIRQVLGDGRASRAGDGVAAA